MKAQIKFKYLILILVSISGVSCKGNNSPSVSNQLRNLFGQSNECMNKNDSLEIEGFINILNEAVHNEDFNQISEMILFPLKETGETYTREEFMNSYLKEDILGLKNPIATIKKRFKVKEHKKNCYYFEIIIEYKSSEETDGSVTFIIIDKINDNFKIVQLFSVG